MILETHERLGRPSRSKVSRAVIYDDHGNALACFLELAANVIDVRLRGQPGFEEALRFLGIRQTVITEVVKLPPQHAADYAGTTSAE